MKTETLKWSSVARRSRHEVLRKLAEDVSAALPAHAISVLTRDERSGAYHGPCSGLRFCSPFAGYLGSTDPALRELLAGKSRSYRETRGPDSGGEGGRTALFPLAVRKRIDHILSISAEDLTDPDARLIEGYCRQAAQAIESFETQGYLKQKIECLSSLVDVVDDLSEERDYRDLLQTSLERSAELLLAEQGSIMLIEKETDDLLLKAAKGAFREPAGPVRVHKGVGIAGNVAQRGEPILVEDIERDPRVAKKNEAKYRTPSFVSVPLKIGHRVVGVMNFTDKISGEFFDDVDLRLAQTCASHVAVVLDRKEISEETEKLRQQAITDHLTGLLNRGCILHRIREELSRSDRFAKSMSVVMLDIDGFKAINDDLGHAAGDIVLQKVAQVMAGAVRSIDIVGRYGGDEFIIILPETDSFFAVNMAERVRIDIAGADMSRATSGRFSNRITASIGIATFPSHGTSAEVLVDHADEALYRAKNSGRDRVVVY